MLFISNLHKVIIVGNSGAGKTVLLRRMIKNVDRDKLLVVDSNHELSKLGKVTENLDAWGKNGRTVLRPARYDSRYLDSIILSARRYYNRLLIIDDLDLFADGSGRLSSKELVNFAINARHQNIGLIVTVKRLSGIAYKVIQQLNHIVFFTVNSLDIPYIEKIAPSLGMWNTESIVRLTQLPYHTFAVFSAKGIQNNKESCDPKEFKGVYRNPSR